MTASDPRSPAKARSTGQAPSLLPPAVRQALEHPGPFALGLDAWLAAECGATHPQGLAAAVRARQLELLNADLCHMALHSPLYRQRLAGVGRWSAAGLRPLHDLAELAELPFTTADDLRPGEALLCVSRDEVARMVTVSTSGSTGVPKRLAFSDAELARTRDFFAVGMAQMVTAGQHVAVLLPGAHRPRGITDLLAGSLAPQGVRVTACMDLADLLLCVPEQAPEGAAARLAAVRAAWQALAARAAAPPDGVPVAGLSPDAAGPVCRPVRCRLAGSRSAPSGGAGLGLPCAGSLRLHGERLCRGRAVPLP